MAIITGPVSLHVPARRSSCPRNITLLIVHFTEFSKETVSKGCRVDLCSSNGTKWHIWLVCSVQSDGKWDLDRNKHHSQWHWIYPVPSSQDISWEATWSLQLHKVCSFPMAETGWMRLVSALEMELWVLCFSFAWHKWSSSAQLVQSMPFSAVQRPPPSHALARLDGAPDAEGETTSVAQLNVKQCQNEPAIQLKKTGGWHRRCHGTGFETNMLLCLWLIQKRSWLLALLSSTAVPLASRSVDLTTSTNSGPCNICLCIQGTADRNLKRKNRHMWRLSDN